MLRICLCLIVGCLLFQFRGICGEEPTVTYQKENVASTNDNDQTAASNDHDNGIYKESHNLLKEDYSDFLGKEESALVPPTPTSSVLSVVVVNGAAGGVAAPVVLPQDIEDVSSMDSTDLNLDYTEDAGAESVQKTGPVKTTLLQTQEERQNINTGTDSGPAAVSDKGTSGDAVDADEVPYTGMAEDSSSSSSSSSTTTVPKVARLPEATETLQDFLQTHIFDSEQVSYPHLSSEVDFLGLNSHQATEALKSVSPSTWENLSGLPVGMGGMAVEPEFVRDSLDTTPFSVVGGHGIGQELKEELGLNGKKKEEEEEFPTFDKWSVIYLAEQEKQKIEKEQEQTVTPSSLQIQKKLRQNFAAASCGAKVVVSNTEAENINFLLNGNPDEYMLNPCKAKKWFVVELCEPLQIHKVELGTMELFSSRPKSFRVFSSQRHPTKEWFSLGKFEMTAERTVQSFHTQVNEEFVKFVRVEMLEHYGDEHYCPITTFRVLGVDMASDEEDETDHEAVETDGEEIAKDLEDEEVEGSVNLFTSAKDTVVKLVKKVLYKGDNEASTREGEEGKEKEHVTSDNSTSEEKKGETGDAEPCLDKNAGVPTVQVPEAGKISPSVSKELEETPIVTKLADTEQLPMDTKEPPIVIKLEREPHEISGSFCYHSPLSSYAYLMAYSPHSLSTCIMRVQETEPAFRESLPTDSKIDEAHPPAEKGPEEATVEEEKEEKKVKEGGIFTEHMSVVNPDEGRVQGVEEAADSNIQKEAEKTDKVKATDPSPPVHVGKVEDKASSSHQQQHIPPVDSVTSSQSTSFTSAGVTSTKSEILEPSSLSTHADLDLEAMSVITPGLDIQQSQVVEHGATDLSEKLFLKVSPTPTVSSDDSIGGEGDIFQPAPTSSEEPQGLKLDDTSQASVDVDGLSSPVTQPPKSETEAINATGPNSSKQGDKIVDLVKVGMPSLLKRDTSLMKLNNRIVALEQNVSMTKKYLEELSRAFKQQNEEMMKLLNKTEKRLNTYIAQSEERDLRQQAQIDVLEQNVSNLTQAVDSMQQRLHIMSKELRDGQLLLVFLQTILFLWLIISSYRGRSRSNLNYSDHQFLLDTMPTKPTIDQTSGGMQRRRNSETVVTSGREQQMDTPIKRQRSETNLAAVGKEPGLSEHLPGIAQKKKKKKKLKQPQISLDSSLSLASTSEGAPAQCSSFSSSAGVLFGTSGLQQQQEQGVVQSGGPYQATAVWASKEQGNLLSVTEPGQATHPQEHDTNQYSQTLNTAFISGLRGLQPFVPAKLRQGEVDIVTTIPEYLKNQPTLSVFSQSPLKEKRAVDFSWKSSPEFKIPAYHRKLRRLADGGSLDSFYSSGLRGVNRKVVNKDQSRKSLTPFDTSKAGEGYFLESNYLSGNRFKFPLSSAGTPLADLESSPRRDFEWDPVGSNISVHSFNDERYPPLLSCPVKRFKTHPPEVSGLPAASIGCQCQVLSSASSRSMSSSASSSSQRSRSPPPLNPAINPLDHNTTLPSFMTAVPPPQPPPPPRPPPPRPPLPPSLAQLSSQSISKPPSTTSSKQDFHNHHSYQTSLPVTTQVLEPDPITTTTMASVKGSSNSDPYNGTLKTTTTTSVSRAHPPSGLVNTTPPSSGITTKNRAFSSGAVQVQANHVRGDDHSTVSLQQTHRRQGSFPQDQLRVSKNTEKEAGRSRQGSIDICKPAGKGGVFSHYSSSKMKKAPSNPSFFARKGSGSSKNSHS